LKDGIFMKKDNYMECSSKGAQKNPKKPKKNPKKTPKNKQTNEQTTLVPAI